MAALDRNNLTEATAAFLCHFRTKRIDSPFLPDWSRIPRDPAYRNECSDAYLLGHLEDSYNVYEVPPSGIDWHECPLACLTRFPIFPNLTLSAHHSGDPKYTRFFVDHSFAYMRAWPIKTFIGQDTERGWRHHYVVASPWYWGMLPERLERWVEALNSLRGSPHLADKELIAILHRMLEETRFLVPQMKKHVDANHNSASYMIRVLSILSAFFDEFAEADHWQETNARFLAQFIGRAFYPDGLYKELTTSYSALVVEHISKTAYSLLDQPAISACQEELRAMLTALIAIVKPTGCLPSLGDHYAGQPAQYLFPPLLKRLGLSWAAAFMAEEKPPPFTHWPAFVQPFYGGYYVMRSDWSQNARYLLIDGGPWGTTHQHGDRLSFVLSAYGADFITDPSCTKYANNEPDALLSVLNAGFLHNTLTVDGVDEFMKSASDLASEEPLQNLWQHTAEFDLFAGDYDFAPLKPVRWQRRVLFFSGAYWLLQDVLSGDQPTAEIEQNFQFEENIKITLKGVTSVATAPNGARLVIKPMSSSLAPVVTIGDRTPHVTYSTQAYSKEEAGNLKPILFPHGRGWIARFTKKMFPATALTYRGKLTLPAVVTVGLFPLKPGQPLREVPAILSAARGESTLWTLHADKKTLKFRTSLATCGIIK